MLTLLKIKNIALIRELELELSEGLNILSGETGAGKSIIIDSLNFVLGDRADKGLIRYGESQASVTAVFSSDGNKRVKDALAEIGIEPEDDLIVGRTMNLSGRSDCRINGTPVNLSVLKNIVSTLVDVHSQHENQALLNETGHIRILDNYSRKIGSLKAEYQVHLKALREAENELKTFPSEAERARQEELLSYEISEIDRVNVGDGEEEELVKARARANNSQKITSALAAAASLLEGDEGFGAMNSTAAAYKELLSVDKYDEKISELAERLESVKIELTDVSDALSEMAGNSSFDPRELAAIEARIEEVRKIKKRFGATTEEINAFREKAQAELERLNNADTRISELDSTVLNEGHNVVKFARALHEERVASGEKFSKAVVKNLAELGMPNCTFAVDTVFPDNAEEILKCASADGADVLKFLISPNKGEPLKPLAKIASGGEMSRFMLGLKNITAELEGIDTLVFDEIDTGISGRIAKVVAEKLYDVSQNRQVIAVTHLPQLASMSDTHYLITKRETADKTLTFIDKLDEEGLIKEIMRLSGAKEGSEIGYESAKELRATSLSYKNISKL